MKNLGEKKTLLGKEFELLIQELKDSGVKVNENFQESLLNISQSVISLLHG